jgi:dethiobiotin synthetase
VSATFVTATGTDIGKTFVTAGLIRHWRTAGRPVDAIKPVVSGFDPAQAAASDPGVLLAALGRPLNEDTVEQISPWRFKAPLAPDMAAAREGKSIDFDALVDHSRRACARARGPLLIEGVGGVMVPLDARRTVLDWIAALRLPVLLVAGSYLGSISHTLTCLDVLARRDLAVRAVVISETPSSPVPLAESVAAIARFAKATLVIGIPRLPAGAFAHPAFAEIAALL